jgi:hypothetical protein
LYNIIDTINAIDVDHGSVRPGITFLQDNARCSGNIPSTQDVVHMAMSMIKIYKGKSTRSYLHLDFTDVVTILTIYYIISHVIYRIFNVFLPL